MRVDRQPGHDYAGLFLLFGVLTLDGWMFFLPLDFVVASMELPADPFENALV